LLTDEQVDHEKVESVLNLIDRDLIAENTLRLVSEPSPTGDEEAASELYRKILMEYGLEADLQYVEEGRPNVVGRIRGISSNPNLLLGGHIDTIPDKECTVPRIEGGRIYGRGSDDMKGSLISMAAAAGALKKSGVKLNGDVLVAAWIDHEDPIGRGKGPKEIARKIKLGELKVDGAIITEGPFDSIAIAQGGAAGFTIEITGRQGAPHTITSYLKSNPILWGSMVVEELRNMDLELGSAELHPLIPQRKSIQLGIFQAGDFYNRLPEKAVIVGTIRWDPTENFKEVEKRFKKRLLDLKTKIHDNLDQDIKMQVDLDLHRDSSETTNENRLTTITQTAATIVLGQSLPLSGLRLVSDQPFFVREAGIPAIYYGPFTADDTTAHSNRESVDMNRLFAMAKVYAASAFLFCG